MKIDRADEHIANVKKRIDAVVSPKSQTSSIHVDRKTKIRTICYRLKKLGDLPNIALVIGDASTI